MAASNRGADHAAVTPTLYGDLGQVKLLTREQERALAIRVERGDFAAKTHMVEANLRLVAKIAGGFLGQGLAYEDLFQEGVLGLIRSVEKFDYRKGYKLSTYATLWIRQAIQRAIQDRGRLIHLPADVSRQAVRIRRARQALSGKLGREPHDSEIALYLEFPVEDVKRIIAYVRDTQSIDAPIASSDGDELVLADTLSDQATPSPAVQSQANAIARSVHRALQELDEPQRQVIELRFGLGEFGETCSVTDTALRLRRSREEVRTLERQALAALRHTDALAAWEPAAPIAA